jgi:membrane associated rhomboid family serine protease
MLPYRDEIPKLRRPYVTLSLIATHALVWLSVQGAGSPERLLESVWGLGLVPGDLGDAARRGTALAVGEAARHAAHLVTSTFVHGSWTSLVANSWFLWLFGSAVEDAMTRPRFLALYLLGGLAAGVAFVAASPSSEITWVGASGAVGAVMGAYLLLYPRARVYALVPFGVGVTSIATPAWTMLLYWAGLQLLSGLASVVDTSAVAAFWAQVGGFGAGMFLVRQLAPAHPVMLRVAPRWRPSRMLLEQ